MIYKKPASVTVANVLLRSTSILAVAVLSFGISGCGGGEKEASAPQAIAVKLKTLESASLIDSSEYVGSLIARDRVSIAPRIDGKISEIFVTQGDRVNRGEPIVRLEPTQEQEEVNAATVIYKFLQSYKSIQ